MSLREYRRKRDFSATAEPEGGWTNRQGAGRRFVIQKHQASRLHYDLRLELGGVLVSWAVPKGLPLTRGEKRLAVKVEDHPLSYIDFEGVIPKGQYGGGTVQVWDHGHFEPLTRRPLKELEEGKLPFVLHGSKLQGEWHLVRLREENQWLIIRSAPDHRPLRRAETDRSALSGRTLTEISREGSGTTARPAPSSRQAPGGRSPAKPSSLNSSGELPWIEPMLAKLVNRPPAGDWLYEMKFDGYRCLAHKEGKLVRLHSRTQHDLTPAFPEVAEALSRLRTRRVLLDGEIVALDADGRPSFQQLQALTTSGEAAAFYYYVFDLLHWNGKSLLQWPLEKRRAKLKALLDDEEDRLRYSASLGSEAAPLLSLAKTHQLEGVVGKRIGSRYEPGRRSGAWIKLKLVLEQEFVIGGYTEPQGRREAFGAIHVGYYEQGRLHYAGKVGTGFGVEGLGQLAKRFARLSRATCPFHDLPAAEERQSHWIRPTLVAQVRFAEWTRDGRLRQPVFVGLREDCPARSVVRETPP